MSPCSALVGSTLDTVTSVTRVKRRQARAAALRREQLLAHSARVLGPAESLGASKVLLVRDADEPRPDPRTVDLVPVMSMQQWRHNEEQRIAVEADFGVSESEARRMVGELRDRGARLGLRLYFAQDDQQVVGGVGYFRLPVPHQSYARLPEVDVFPGWRGQGYGDGLLTAGPRDAERRGRQHRRGGCRRRRLAAVLAPATWIPRHRAYVAGPLPLMTGWTQPSLRRARSQRGPRPRMWCSGLATGPRPVCAGVSGVHPADRCVAGRYRRRLPALDPGPGGAAD